MDTLKNLHKGKYREVLLYGIIGGGAVFIELSLFWILYIIGGGDSASGAYIAFANVLAISVAIIYSFTLNSIFTFKTRDHLFKRFMSFVGVALVGMGMSTLIVLAADALGISVMLAKIASLPLIFIVQYTLNRLLTFRGAKPTEATLKTLISEGDIV